MNIIITDFFGAIKFSIPNVPTNVQSTIASENTEVDTLRGRISVTGSQKLNTLSWSSYIPIKTANNNEDGGLLDGWTFVRFMNQIRLPIRVVVTDNTRLAISNMLMTVESFNYSVDKIGDIQYTISLKEFPYGLWDLINIR